jgi:hypothetical protein
MSRWEHLHSGLRRTVHRRQSGVDYSDPAREIRVDPSPRPGPEGH